MTNFIKLESLNGEVIIDTYGITYIATHPNRENVIVVYHREINLVLSKEKYSFDSLLKIIQK